MHTGAVPRTSRGADAAPPTAFTPQHDPCRASALARRTGGDDDGLLGALQPLDLLEVGDPCSRLVTASRMLASLGTLMCKNWYPTCRTVSDDHAHRG
jgi:hypothetical protein